MPPKKTAAASKAAAKDAPATAAKNKANTAAKVTKQPEPVVESESESGAEADSEEEQAEPETKPKATKTKAKGEHIPDIRLHDLFALEVRAACLLQRWPR
jgi:hypothetical protein